ncbi:MAG: hypothetical protein IT373_01715 [Polyangiaceae bacterium]|nr:hypothetical protein [Polyangiaceae bacterium]
MSHFAYLLYPTRPGFSPATLTPVEAETIDRHFHYLEELLARGQLLLAGPCLDGSLGLGIFETETEAEARALMAADPAVVAGVFRAEVRPMRISLLRQR